MLVPIQLDTMHSVTLIIVTQQLVMHPYLNPTETTVHEKIAFQHIKELQPLTTIAHAMRGSPARPGQLALEGKTKEEFLNSARRGHEDDGGEGPFGRELSCPRVSQWKKRGHP